MEWGKYFEIQVEKPKTHSALEFMERNLYFEMTKNDIVTVGFFSLD